MQVRDNLREDMLDYARKCKAEGQDSRTVYFGLTNGLNEKVSETAHMAGLGLKEVMTLNLILLEVVYEVIHEVFDVRVTRQFRPYRRLGPNPSLRRNQGGS